MGQSTLRQALYEGRGPRAVKFPGSDRWRFRPSDLEAYVKAGEISPTQGVAGVPDAGAGGCINGGLTLAERDDLQNRVHAVNVARIRRADFVFACINEARVSVGRAAGDTRQDDVS